MEWVLPISVACAGVALGGVVGAGEAGPKIPQGWIVSPQNDKAPGAAGFRILHEASGIELVFVPGGTFTMGSEEGDPDERPLHEVDLSSFWIGRTEVTVAQYRRVIGNIPDDLHGHKVNDQGDDHPVVALGQDLCMGFCEPLGLRLPTEAEWEYAAAGPDGHKYPWGDEWDGTQLQWAKHKWPLSGDRTAPVGSYPAGASWCGALDMAGNVWEWCADWYSETFYAVSPRANPTGPPEGVPICLGQPDGSKHWWLGPRIAIRGGCFANDDPLYLRCAVRSNDPSLWHYALGLRVARTAD